MIASELLDQLDQLGTADKLQVVKRLVDQIELAQLGFDVNQTYEVWSPEDNGNITEVLMELLEEAEKKRHA